MTAAQRISQVQRLEEMREDAIELRNETMTGSSLYNILCRVVLDLDEALDGLRF